MIDVIFFLKVKCQSQQKDLIARNIHVKYFNSSTHCLKKLKARLKFSKCRYQVKPQDQGHLSKYRQVPRERSCHKENSCEISKFQHKLIKNYLQDSSYIKIRSDSKVKVTAVTRPFGFVVPSHKIKKRTAPFSHLFILIQSL